MKDRGIGIKVILPIMIFVILIFVLGALRIHFLINKILINQRIMLLNAINEDLSAHLHSSKTVQDFVKLLKNDYTPQEGYAIMVKQKGKPVYSTLSFPHEIQIKNNLIFIGKDPIGIYLYDKKRSLEVFLIKKLHLSGIYKQLNDIFSAFSLAFVLMLLGFIILIRKNLINPIKKVMKSIEKGECAQPVGVREIDDMVEVINDALASLELENIEKETLYRIAIALNEPSPFEETIDKILYKARVLLEAEFSALALYDEEGRFSWLSVSGQFAPSVEDVGRLPEGKGILQLLKLSMKPVRIKDVREHEAFSGLLPNGHPIIKSFLGYPIFSRDGKPLGALYFANKRTGEFTDEDENILVAIASNIAIAIERYKEQQELKRFKEIIEASFDCVIVTDKEGKINYVNPAFERLTGFSKDEVIGKSPSILQSGFHSKQFYEELWKQLRAGKPWKGEFINMKKNGAIYTVSTIIFPVMKENGEIQNYVAVQRDITEEKKLYEQLLRAQKMEAIGTLAGGIAHDFKNLMTVILGYAEVIKDTIKPENSLWKFIDIIEKTAQRGASLASKILTVTKKESLEMKVIDINAIVKETLEILERSIPKEIEIRVSLQKNLPPIKADPTQLQQVILNLAINAKEAMPEGGKLYISTSKVGREDGAANGLDGEGFIRLTVQDTGKGIDKELQSKIFDPFFTTKKEAGTGLGLYIVHSIVSAHNGYINLYSEPGKGTKFNIYIPVYHGRAEPQKQYNIQSIKGEGAILIIDDEIDILNLVEDLLTPLGYKVYKASDGYEAIKILRKYREEIKAIILDIVMPRLSGREVYQQIKSITPETPVILCSGYTADGLEVVRELLREGAKAFIQKPFTRATLGATLKRVISKSRQ